MQDSENKVDFEPFEAGVKSAWYANDCFDELQGLTERAALIGGLDLSTLPAVVQEVLTRERVRLDQAVYQAKDTFALASDEAEDYFSGEYTNW